MLSVVLFALSCDDDAAPPVGNSADADTDTDSDSDTDTDTDVTGDHLTGQMVLSVEDAEANAICAKTVALAGEPYSGECLGCVFAFDVIIDPTASTDDCSSEVSERFAWMMISPPELAGAYHRLAFKDEYVWFGRDDPDDGNIWHRTTERGAASFEDGTLTWSSEDHDAMLQLTALATGDITISKQ